ncbi:DUF4376 domain-containing protein [Pseudomonas sp. CCC3.2]|uniref:DUF4376 domain-containing protein n=1 Tax=Pseudomonas sp. CCC3.2 TaxID=3048608 RepID=UPI002B22BE34|nr:DUF4376 domain-containing protein [Pseudomonas sp. CCC3.2]MEB0178780.1 DUF4376 domain-containing protein [Pseudomonas sp. CCC3.2]
MSIKYLLFGSDGQIAQRLVDSINEIPKGAIKVTDDVWLATANETDGIWMLGADGTISKSPRPVDAPDYPALFASERFTHETAGITVNGMAVYTGRTTQNKLTGAAVRAGREANYTVNWKLSDNTFVNLTSTQLIAIANAVGDHVQACYDREAALLAAVADKSYTEAMLQEGWPT